MTDIAAVRARLKSAERELAADEGQERSLKVQLEELQKEAVSLTASLVNNDRATSLLNSIGEEKQLAAQDAIEQLVTRGLQTIFGEDLTFHIIQDVKAKRAEVSFVVRSHLSNGQVIETDIIDARGGGLAATVGFLLRLVVMLLKTDTRTDNVLVLDETFAHVSDEYLPALGEFLRKIVDKTGVQIIMVTHQPEFTEYADKVYRFTAKDGKTVVKEEG